MRPTDGLAPLKIAIFHNLHAGGAKRALYEQTAALAARGHHLDVYTLSTADEAYMPMADVAERVIVEPVALPGMIETRWLPFALQWINLRRRLAGLDALAAAHRRVAEAINRGGYDLAFVHHDNWTKAPHVLRHLTIPSVYYCQEPLRVYYEHSLEPVPVPRGLKGRLRAAWYAPIEPWYAKRHKADDAANARAADMVLANSYYSRESILRAYGIAAHVAPLGVNTQLFHPTGATKEHAVISVGRFQANKRQALVIEAVAQLEAALRPKVILVGDATGSVAYRDQLVALAASRGVALELLEHVSDAVLVAAYNRAKLAVFVPVMEPFGFVPLEAAACGLPTVGVREAGVRETVRHGETGLLTAPEPAAVGMAIAELLQDAPRRERLGAQALAHVREAWTWQRSGEVLETYLRQALRPR